MSNCSGYLGSRQLHKAQCKTKNSSSLWLRCGVTHGSPHTLWANSLALLWGWHDLSPRKKDAGKNNLREVGGVVVADVNIQSQTLAPQSTITKDLTNTPDKMANECRRSKLSAPNCPPWMANSATAAAGLHKNSHVKSTKNGLGVMSGHPHAFSKALFMLRGAVMHPRDQTILTGLSQVTPKPSGTFYIQFAEPTLCPKMFKSH